MKSETSPAGGPPPAEGVTAAALAEVLRGADQALREIDFGRLTAEVLLAQVMGLTRAQLQARLEQPFPSSLRPALDRLVERAAHGEPLAYLTGRREFYGLDFAVDARVLVPRPETEQLVELGLAFLAQAPPEPKGWRVWDVGTGSGILAVTLAVKCPAVRAVASDLSAGALAVAQSNAARHGVADRLHFVQSDLLSAFGLHACDLLVANLPYIPSTHLRSLPVYQHEPALALDGGPDGLALVGRLLAEAPRVMAAGGRVLLEIEDTCGPAAHALAQAAFPEAQIVLRPDLAGLDRVVDIAL
jgi:release factor glutamine methyltransferase